MDNATGSGPPSCGGIDNRLNHAKCAINQIVNSYGEMVFALGRFRETPGGTFATSCDANNDIQGNGGDQCTTAQVSCNATDASGEMLTGLVDGANQDAAIWTDFACGSCGGPGTPLSAQPEIWGVGSNTPLGGVLKSGRRYWSGLQSSDATPLTIWPAASPGFDPIRTDPTRTTFLSKPGFPATCNSTSSCDATAGCTSNNCCCLEQCRPYITILLTDGAETCGGDAPAAAATMLATPITQGAVTRTYRIETKAIGFGINPGNAAIEAIAQAGGAPDVVGVNEGFYARDESSLQLAMSAILDDAIKTEVCNNRDDDCDTFVDEGFNVGTTCNNGGVGECRATGAIACQPNGTSACSVAGVVIPPGIEGAVCNNKDDDCDGKIDENIPGCICFPQGEQCNAVDDNCNGQIDEGLGPRQCNNGNCLGTETCIGGSYQGCTAPTPGTEICDNLDNDCDGVVDSFTQQCSTMPTNGFPAGDPRNNPGAHPGPSPSCIAEGPAICLCHPGNQACNAGVVGACVGEIKPGTEVCNTLDEDCDGKVDEGTGGQDCSTQCGIGTTACVGGVITCNAMPAMFDDTCDGNDDDCDGNIDEDYIPTPGACGVGTVCMGMERCINGTPTCVGDPIGVESCNCGDDDCDTKVDEGVVCGNGAQCRDCQCAFPCVVGSEFPCPTGKKCSVDNFCIEDPCFAIDCPPIGGVARECVVTGNAGACADACANETCDSGFKCQPESGQCMPDTCAAFPDKCAASENCISGVCVSNPCAGVTCPGANEYCVAGTCHPSCANVNCETNQRCELGVCVPNPCNKECPIGRVCDDATAQCVVDPCIGVPCAGGQWCDPRGDGSCSDDPCVGTTCPDPAQVCKGGTCDFPQSSTVDGGAEEHVTTGGGGGCSSSNTSGCGLVFVGLIGLALVRRRRRVSSVATRTGGAL